MAASRNLNELVTDSIEVQRELIDFLNQRLIAADNRAQAWERELILQDVTKASRERDRFDKLKDSFTKKEGVAVRNTVVEVERQLRANNEARDPNSQVETLTSIIDDMIGRQDGSVLAKNYRLYRKLSGTTVAYEDIFVGGLIGAILKITDVGFTPAQQFIVKKHAERITTLLEKARTYVTTGKPEKAAHSILLAQHIIERIATDLLNPKSPAEKDQEVTDAIRRNLSTQIGAAEGVAVTRTSKATGTSKEDLQRLLDSDSRSEIHKEVTSQEPSLETQEFFGAEKIALHSLMNTLYQLKDQFEKNIDQDTLPMLGKINTIKHNLKKEVKDPIEEKTQNRELKVLEKRQLGIIRADIAGFGEEIDSFTNALVRQMEQRFLVPLRNSMDELTNFLKDPQKNISGIQRTTKHQERMTAEFEKMLPYLDENLARIFRDELARSRALRERAAEALQNATTISELQEVVTQKSSEILRINSEIMPLIIQVRQLRDELENSQGLLQEKAKIEEKLRRAEKTLNDEKRDALREIANLRQDLQRTKKDSEELFAENAETLAHAEGEIQRLQQVAADAIEHLTNNNTLALSQLNMRLIDTEGRLQITRERLADAEKALAESKIIAERFTHQVDKLEKTLQLKEMAEEKGKEDVGQLTRELVQARSDAAEAKKQVATTAAWAEQTQRELQKALTDAKTAADLERTALSKNITAAETKARENAERANALEQEVEALNTNLSQAEANAADKDRTSIATLANLEDKLRDTQARLDNANREKHINFSLARKLEETSKQARARIVDLERTLATNNVRVSELKKEVDRHIAAAQQAAAEHQAETTALAEQANAREAALRGELSTARGTIDELSRTREALIKALQESQVRTTQALEAAQLETDIAVQARLTAEARADNLLREATDLQNLLTDARANLEKQFATEKSDKKTIAQFEQTIAGLINDLTASERAAKRAQEEVELFANAAIQKAEQQRELAERARQQAQSRLEELQQQSSETQQRLEDALAQAKEASARDRVNADQLVAQLRHELETTNTQAATAASAAKELAAAQLAAEKTRTAEVTAQANELDERVRNLTAEITRADKTKTDLERQLADLRAQLLNREGAIKGQRATFEGIEGGLRAEISRLEDRIENQRTDLQELRSQKSDAQAQAEAARNALAEARTRNAVLEQSILDARANEERERAAAETANAQRLAAVADKATADAARMAEQDARKRAEAETQLAKAQADAAQQSAAIANADAAKAAEEAARFRAETEVARRNEIEATQGAEYARQQQAEAESAKQRAIIAQAEAEEARASAINAQALAAAENAASLKAKESAEEQARLAEDLAIAANATAKEAKERADIAAAEVAMANERIIALNSELGSANSETLTAISQLNAANQELQQALARISEIEAEKLAAIAAAKNDAADNIAAAKNYSDAEIQNAQAEARAAQQMADAARVRADASQEEIARLNLDIIQANNREAQARADAENYARKVDEARAEADAFRAEIRKLTDEQLAIAHQSTNPNEEIRRAILNTIADARDALQRFAQQLRLQNEEQILPEDLRWLGYLDGLAGSTNDELNRLEDLAMDGGPRFEASNEYYLRVTNGIRMHILDQSEVLNNMRQRFFDRRAQEEARPNLNRPGRGKLKRGTRAPLSGRPGTPGDSSSSSSEEDRDNRRRRTAGSGSEAGDDIAAPRSRRGKKSSRRTPDRISESSGDGPRHPQETTGEERNNPQTPPETAAPTSGATAQPQGATTPAPPPAPPEGGPFTPRGTAAKKTTPGGGDGGGDGEDKDAKAKAKDKKDKPKKPLRALSEINIRSIDELINLAYALTSRAYNTVHSKSGVTSAAKEEVEKLLQRATHEAESIQALITDLQSKQTLTEEQQRLQAKAEEAVYRFNKAAEFARAEVDKRLAYRSNSSKAAIIMNAGESDADAIARLKGMATPVVTTGLIRSRDDDGYTTSDLFTATTGRVIESAMHFRNAENQPDKFNYYYVQKEVDGAFSTAINIPTDEKPKADARTVPECLGWAAEALTNHLYIVSNPYASFELAGPLNPNFVKAAIVCAIAMGLKKPLIHPSTQVSIPPKDMAELEKLGNDMRARFGIQLKDLKSERGTKEIVNLFKEEAFAISGKGSVHDLEISKDTPEPTPPTSQTSTTEPAPDDNELVQGVIGPGRRPAPAARPVSTTPDGERTTTSGTESESEDDLEVRRPARSSTTAMSAAMGQGAADLSAAQRRRPSTAAAESSEEDTLGRNIRAPQNSAPEPAPRPDESESPREERTGSPRPSAGPSGSDDIR